MVNSQWVSESVNGEWSMMNSEWSMGMKNEKRKVKNEVVSGE